jgi:hypothetical protein
MIGIKRKKYILGILTKTDLRKEVITTEPSQDRLSNIPEEYWMYDKLF